MLYMQHAHDVLVSQSEILLFWPSPLLIGLESCIRLRVSKPAGKKPKMIAEGGNYGRRES